MGDGVDKWAQPKDGVQFFTPIDELIPTLEELPIEFQREMTAAQPWITIICDTFYESTRVTAYQTHENIDGKTAIRHIRTAMQSWEISHERKIRGLAWLMSRWFKSYRYEIVKPLVMTDWR